MEYGYARVSTKEQNEERQLIALRAAGLHNHQIFLDKQSGKDFNRCQYQRLLRRLKRGNTLIIKSIDRLGRNFRAVAYHHSGKASRYRGPGHAAAGHTSKPRSHWYIDSGYCPSAS